MSSTTTNPNISANAIGGKTARACESCIKKRASWYCAADDAFLCRTCDSWVHSANNLASRHTRVRLHTASHYYPEQLQIDRGRHSSGTSWQRGWFTRKARTTLRHRKVQNIPKKPCPVPVLRVPEFGEQDAAAGAISEEELLFRVPIDPLFDADGDHDPGLNTIDDQCMSHDDDHVNIGFGSDGYLSSCFAHGGDFGAYKSLDAELPGLSMDVESFLGHELGTGWSCVAEESDKKSGGVVVSVQQGVGAPLKLAESSSAVVSRRSGDQSHNSLSSCVSAEDVDGEDRKKVVETDPAAGDGGDADDRREVLFLRLDYEAVIAAWGSKGLPWTTGTRPHLGPGNGWAEWRGGEGHKLQDDEGRRARLSRYREKRNSRLFTKKIRYQVRKTNAEKRPRMKGRFIKRTEALFCGSGCHFPYFE